MYEVRYDLPEAVDSFEFLLEQARHGADVIISRNGVEIAKVTGIKGTIPGSQSSVGQGGAITRRERYS